MVDQSTNDLLKYQQEEKFDWEKARRHARSRERPSDWPANVQAISLQGLSLLGIDEQNRLYWDGKRLATLTLTGWQKLGAFLVTVSAVIAAASAAVSAIADWLQVQSSL